MACITLCCARILVRKQVLHGIQVCAEFYLQRCIGVAERMERDVLGDTRALYPFIQRMVEHLISKSWKYLSLATWLDQSECFVADGYIVALLCLLTDEVEVESAVSVLTDVVPIEVSDVGASQPCEARKERGTA